MRQRYAFLTHKGCALGRHSNQPYIILCTSLNVFIKNDKYSLAFPPRLSKECLYLWHIPAKDTQPRANW